MIDFIEIEISKKILALAELLDDSNVLATITQAEFQTLCDNNLMTDAQIDATNLSVALKTNLKFNNLYTRKSSRALIACRDLLKYLAKRL